MKLKIPPALVTLIFGALMYALQMLLPFGDFDFTGRGVFWKVLFVVGGVIGLIGVAQFVSKGTTIDPVKADKASQLVNTGLYKYSRNPMYVGLLLFLIAIALKLGNAFNALLIGGFVFYMNEFQIKPEEEALLNRFGKSYKQYCNEVRRWF